MNYISIYAAQLQVPLVNACSQQQVVGIALYQQDINLLCMNAHSLHACWLVTVIQTQQSLVRTRYLTSKSVSHSGCQQGQGVSRRKSKTDCANLIKCQQC